MVGLSLLVSGSGWLADPITQKYQYPIIPQREKGGAGSVTSDGTVNGTLSHDEAELDAAQQISASNNISTFSNDREMHLILALQLKGVSAAKSVVIDDNHLNTPLWKLTSQIKYVTDSGQNGYAIDMTKTPPFILDEAFYSKEWNANDARDDDVGKPWIPSRSELLKFFGWKEAAIAAQAGEDELDFSLSSKHWAADEDLLGDLGRSKTGRGFIRIGDTRPANGSGFAVENNIVKGIDIGGGHNIDDNAFKAKSFDLTSLAGLQLDSNNPKFFSAVGKIDQSTIDKGGKFGGAATNETTFQKVAFKFENIFL